MESGIVLCAVLGALAAGGLLGFLLASFRHRSDLLTAEQRVTSAAQAKEAELRERLAQATERGASLEQARVDSLRLKDEAHAAQIAEKERALQAQLSEKQKAIDEQRELLAQAERTFADKFDALSVKALKSATDEFLKVAAARFETTQEEARGQLAQRQQAIEELLRPVREALTQLGQQCQEMEQRRVSAYDAVSDQINRLMSETGQLSNALRRPTVRGSWGEITLRTVAADAGLVEGQDFELQHSTDADEGKLRADMVVRLPHKRAIVIDSKTPLEAFREAANAQDEQARAQHLQHHARLVRSHVRQLSAKSYWQQYEGADYVILFLPAESIYQAAMECDPTLLEDAVKARVLLANPMTLVGLLRAVAYVLDQERLNQNATEISEIGRRLYDGVRTYAGHMNKLGRHLRQSVEAYNDSVGSLERSVLSRARQLRAKGVGGGEAFADPDGLDVLPAAFRSAELSALPTAPLSDFGVDSVHEEVAA